MKPSTRTVSAAVGCVFLAIGLALPGAAHASKQAVDFFGGSGTLGGQFSSPEGVAVNYTGAGGVPAGTIYVTDGGSFDVPTARGNRVQRFERDDNGTPADAADDTYSFIAAWGAGVLSGGSDYEICAIAASCLKGTPTGGNGTQAGNGALNKPSGIAVDQDTGTVYVLDSGSRRTPDNNFRVNAYTPTGTFLYSFGFDVDATTPGTGYEVCPATDACKQGTPGAGAGQIGADASGQTTAGSIAVSAPDANPATGAVYVADPFNSRVNTYGLDGSSPGAIGSSAQFATGKPDNVAVDSRGILYADNSTNNNQLERYDSQGRNGPVGFLAPIAAGVNEAQAVTIAATAGAFNLSFDPDGAGPQPAQTTADLPYNAAGSVVRDALRALPGIGATGVVVGGGPGGSSPYRVTFQGSSGAKDVTQLDCANGTPPLSGGSGCSVVTTTAGQPGLIAGDGALSVDPDSDGPGPDADVLYAGRFNYQPIQQFGPANPPGLIAPPTDDDDRHGTNGTYSNARGLAVEPTTGRLYAASSGVAGPGVYVLDNSSPIAPTATLDSCDNLTVNSAECHATIDPNGPPATRYHFEYSADGSDWTALPEVFLGAQDDPQDIDITLRPLPIGLSPNTTYHVRLIAGRKLATPILTNELSFTTASAPPIVETAGAPVRTTASAQLNGRVTPLGTATSYHFEYGTAGPCGSNPCASTPDLAAGSGQLTRLAAAEIDGLDPDTTYHYRLIADNGVGSPVSGGEMTVHTRSSDTLPGQSDQFPGPPGSDRAWEMVSLAETSGNPLSAFAAGAFSDNGNRAAYGIAGGTPIGPGGTFSSIYMSQRTASGWQPSLVFPEREEMIESGWTSLHAADDLSSLAATNQRDGGGGRGMQIWRLRPDAVPSLLFEQIVVSETRLATSAEGSRVLAQLIGAPLDPAYPAAATRQNIYDVSSASPQLASLLPGNLIGPCGSLPPAQDESNPVSADGALAYFEARPTAPCEGIGASAAQLYVRDLIAAQSRLISGPALSGPDCGGSLIAATPDAAFFVTCSRLDPVDGGGNDVYRYQLSDGALDCVTCVIAGFDVNVEGEDAIAVAEDGSRLYFTTRTRLLPGAPPDGERGIYRVEVATGALAYLAPIAGGNIGVAFGTTELDADGQVFAFSSDLGFLNPLGGTADNGAATQYYRYDGADRSLICASCPQDGSAPLGGPVAAMHRTPDAGHNQRLLSADGDTLAFSTPTPLAGADQNTPDTDPVAGTDAYEWRDGRQILVSDGLTSWPSAPNVVGISPSGADVYFAAPAAYTPDAPDALIRLYDARIGGGISFPVPPPPCPLEVCQGTPRGAPDDPFPSSGSVAGRGNLSAPSSSPRRCPKGKRKVRRKGKVRCVPKRAQHKPLRCPKGKRKVRRGGVVRCVKRPRHQRRANHHRRAAR